MVKSVTSVIKNCVVEADLSKADLRKVHSFGMEMFEMCSKSASQVKIMYSEVHN